MQHEGVYELVLQYVTLCCKMTNKLPCTLLYVKYSEVIWNNRKLKSLPLFKGMFFSVSGENSRLESVGEDDELFVENGVSSCVLEKPPPGRRKHSLPQQLDTAGVRQVGECLTFFLMKLKVFRCT